jgi:hypothetical protein
MRFLACERKVLGFCNVEVEYTGYGERKAFQKKKWRESPLNHADAQTLLLCLPSDKRCSLLQEDMSIKEAREKRSTIPVEDPPGK